MKLKMIAREDGAEILMEGRLDSNTAAETESILKGLTEKYDKLVLNLLSLEYISSAGLRTLKTLHILMAKKGGRLVLKNANKTVMEVFEMTGFAGLLSFE